MTYHVAKDVKAVAPGPVREPAIELPTVSVQVSALESYLTKTQIELGKISDPKQQVEVRNALLSVLDNFSKVVLGTKVRDEETIAAAVKAQQEITVIWNNLESRQLPIDIDALKEGLQPLRRELNSYFDNAITVAQNNERNAAWYEKIGTQVQGALVKTAETTADLTLGNLAYLGGVDSAAAVIRFNQEIANKFGGSVLGTTDDLAVRNSRWYQDILALHPIVQLGGVAQPIIESLDYGHQNYKKWVAGKFEGRELTEEEFQQIQTQDTLFKSADYFLDAGIISGSLAVGGVGATNQVATIGKIATVTTGFSAVSASLQELYLSRENNEQLNIRRFSENFLNGMAGSSLFMGGLSAASTALAKCSCLNAVKNLNTQISALKPDEISKLNAAVETITGGVAFSITDKVKSIMTTAEALGKGKDVSNVVQEIASLHNTLGLANAGEVTNYTLTAIHHIGNGVRSAQAATQVVDLADASSDTQDTANMLANAKDKTQVFATLGMGVVNGLDTCDVSIGGNLNGLKTTTKLTATLPPALQKGLEISTLTLPNPFIAGDTQKGIQLIHQIPSNNIGASDELTGKGSYHGSSPELDQTEGALAIGRAIDSAAEGIKLYDSTEVSPSQNQNLPFRVSPEPFVLPSSVATTLAQDCQDISALYAGLHLVLPEIQSVSPIVQKLFSGDRAPLIEYAMSKPNHLFIRPDMILTDKGPIIAEVETSPFGLGLSCFLDQAYRNAGYNPIGNYQKYFDQIADKLCADGKEKFLCISYTDHTANYKGQLEYLASQMQRPNLDVVVRHVDDIQTDGTKLSLDGKEVDYVYRGFYLHESKETPIVNSIVNRHSQQMIPNPNAFIEEKAIMALLWDPALEPTFRHLLGSRCFDNLRRIIPPTFIVDSSHFPENFPANITSWEQLATLPRSQRQYVLKSSGFSSDSSWGKSVKFLDEVSAQKCQDLIQQALTGNGLYVLQVFEEGTKMPVNYCDFAKSQLQTMNGRVRFTPYVDLQTGEIITGKATIRSGSNYIHGASDSINTTVLITENDE